MRNKTVLVQMSVDQAEFFKSAARELERMMVGEMRVDAVAARLVNRASVENFRALSHAINNPASPSVVLGMEGDWVQGATANMPVNVVLIDHDRDEGDSDRAREIQVLVNESDHDELLENEGLGDDEPAIQRPKA